MFAVLRLNSFDKLAASGERLEEFDEVHAAQPGYIGSVVVDVGEGRRFVLNLWESEEDSAAAFPSSGPKSDGSWVRSCPVGLSSLASGT